MQIICFRESLPIFALTLHILLVLVNITRQKLELISSVIGMEQQQQQKNNNPILTEEHEPEENKLRFIMRKIKQHHMVSLRIFQIDLFR